MKARRPRANYAQGTLSSLLERGTADSALAEPSGAGGGALARCPQTADFVSNVSARRAEALFTLAEELAGPAHFGDAAQQ